VDDYPYGFRLRCKIRYWIEYKASHGFRFVSQTTNPKVPGERWNKPKAGQYVRLGMGMFLDEKGHVSHTAISGYELEPIIEFLKHWHDDKNIITNVVAFTIAKRAYARKEAEIQATGFSGWTINGEKQAVRPSEIESTQKDLEVLSRLVPLVNEYAAPFNLHIKEETK
jgi:hypothetical protein